MPNVLTVMRMICSVLLLFAEPLSAMFFGIYAACGASDILDGYMARKAKTATRLGASLDSIADAVFIGTALYIFIPILHLPLWILCWIGAIALMRIGSLAVGFFKYRALSFLHTYANKATGLALFCFPFLYGIFGLTITAGLLCGLSSVSAVEELVINIRSRELVRDVPSIFRKGV